MKDFSLVALACENEEDLLFYAKKNALGIWGAPRVYAQYLARRAWSNRCRSRECASRYMAKAWDSMEQIKALSGVKFDEILEHQETALDALYGSRG